MAYCGSPQDLFASEDSDSDATVDLSVPPGTGASCPTDHNELVMSVSCRKQNQNQQQSRRRRFQHTVSSSDSEDDSRHSASDDNKCLLAAESEELIRANSATETLSSENNTDTNADKRVSCSQHLVMDQLDDRPLCKYGVNCYRRNPSHFKEFRHPGNV